MSNHSARNPMAEAVRRAIHTTAEKPPSAGQHIQAMVSIAGEQELRLDTHGSGNRRDWGGHIALSSDTLLIYLHDQIAARMYAAAWVDAWYNASKLPETVEAGPPARGPVTMVRAHGSDSVDHVHDVARNVALIKIGGLTWRIHDWAAWASTEQKWREISAIAPMVLPVCRYEPTRKAPKTDYEPPAWPGNQRPAPRL
jgi:hypothetical protein